MPSWDSAEADDLWTEACGKDRWLGEMETLEQDIRRHLQRPAVEIPLRRQHVPCRILPACDCPAELAASGASTEAVDQAKHLFDPNALTLGFARRFATYKRPNLLLHDPDRLASPAIRSPASGTAHHGRQGAPGGPRRGRPLIQEWVHFIRRPEVRPHVIFLSDYDMLLAERLVQGVDVWINTPRRPWEASGTSGMKVLVNGGINLSELDGWWAEAYTPEVGWALGDGREHGDDPAWDAVEANALYDLLEREVIPQFYTRDESGIPTAWVARMRESMARLTPRFSTNRAVREYTEQRYLPAAAAYRARAAEKGAVGGNIVTWKRTLKEKWSALRFGDVKVSTDAAQHVFEAEVYLDDLDPTAVQVELYADGIDGSGPIRQEMARGASPAGAPERGIYRASVPTARPAADFTARIIPRLRRRRGAPGSRFHPLAAMNAGHPVKEPERADVRVGVPLPLGVYAHGEGVNFALFSRHASRVRLELFDHPEEATAARSIDLDPSRNRTGDVWHVWVQGIRPGQLYAYRVDGPYEPGEGHRFNFHKLLLDPFATAITRAAAWDFGQARGYDPSVPDGDSVCSTVDDAGAMPKCVFTQEHFHWQDDRPPRHPCVEDSHL